MAGQPPEPSFQPSGRDRDRDRDAGLTQGRPAWQQPGYGQPEPGYGQPEPGYGQPEPGYQARPGYSQPAGAGQQAYAAPSYSQPPDPGYAAQDRGYSTPGQGYAAPEQPGYAAPGQASAQPDEYQGYQGYQAPGYSPPGQDQDQAQGAGAGQWQGIAGMKPAAGKPRSSEKGFVGSLFDFSFSSFVTPKIIKVLYVLFTIWTVLVALFFLFIGFKDGGIWGGLFTLIIADPIFIALTLGVWRVVLEAFMVVFRIYEETQKIAGNSANRD